MIAPGLTSVTFRSLRAEKILQLALEANLAAIEWGGDLHVPHGEIPTAERVRRLCADAGLRTPSYGSYCRAGCTEPGTPSFEAALDSAQALGANTVRVWAGKQASASANAEDWRRVTTDLQQMAERAARVGMTVAVEYHANTLTDTPEAARRLLDAVPHPAFGTYWQPPHDLNADQRLKSLVAVLDRLANLHVFHWIQSEKGRDRRPLQEGEPAWQRYLAVAAKSPGTHFAFLEFVRGESREQFLNDAATLLRLLRRTPC